MIEIQVLDKSGEASSSVQVDEQKLGGTVRRKLLKQAVIMYEANRRQGTASSKTRSEVSGSTRKLYRQKGTGHARMGSNRSPVRRGGGAAFGPKPRDFGWQMPRKARRVATRSALLAKLRDNQVMAVETLAMEEIRTKQVVDLLRSLKVDESCLFVTAKYNKELLLSARNLPKVGVAVAGDLNAFEILRHNLLIVEKEALEQLAGAAS
jgi:large subunit ribosomal protein L4